MTLGLFSMDEKKPPWRYLGIHKVLDVFTWLVRWRLSGLQFGEAVASVLSTDTAVSQRLAGPSDTVTIVCATREAPRKPALVVGLCRCGLGLGKGVADCAHVGRKNEV